MHAEPCSCGNLDDRQFVVLVVVLILFGAPNTACHALVFDPRRFSSFLFAGDYLCASCPKVNAESSKLVVSNRRAVLEQEMKELSRGDVVEG